MSITLTALQKQRRDTAANWTSANPTLLAGEIGLESDTGYWKVGDGSTAWTSLAYVSGLGAEIPVSRLADGSARQLLQTAANGTDVEWTSNVDVPGTLDVTSDATFDSNVTIQGDLTVNGTTTTIDTTNLAIEDKNIEIGKVATPTDVTADGGGITLKGTTDKTINWIDATDAWTLSEHVNIASGKEYRINGTKVLDATSLGSNVLITSTNITDGTIVNGDINASAAIAGTKISPDFGSQTIATTGIVSHALGSQGAPTVTFTGDPNTGIYSPGADQVAISTGGSGRLFINSAGNVGIGAANTGAAFLEVGGSLRWQTQGIFRNSTNTSTLLRFAEIGSRDVRLDTWDGTDFNGTIRHGAQTYLVETGTGASLTERLRITSAGLVGIGTSSITGFSDYTTVQLGSSSSGSALRLVASGDTPGTDDFVIYKNTSGSYLRSYGDPIIFHGSSAEYARFDTSGRLGIGTQSPGGVLEAGAVSGSVTSGDLLVTTGSTTARVTVGRLSGTTNDNTSFRVRNRVDSTLFQVDTNAVTFGPTGTEAARIDSSGRLLVGTSSAPTVSDAQYGLLRTQGNTSSANGFGVFSIGRGQAPASIASGSELGHILFTANDGSAYASISGYSDAAGGTNDYPGRLVFSTTADGASSPTERMKIDSTGKVFAVGVYNATTGVGANVAVDSAGHLQRSTSSIKYKTDVETLEDMYADALLQCRPVWYRSTCAVDDPKHSYWGFIAEEVAEIDPRLVHWKTTEPVVQENGSIENVACVPEPEGVAYERFVPHLLNMIKRQKEQIEAMEARLAALESA